MAEFPNFKGSWPWPWPQIGSYCIPPCITRRPLPTYQISLKSKKTFCGRTDVRTYGQMFETHFIRSIRRSRPNNQSVGTVLFAPVCSWHWRIDYDECQSQFNVYTQPMNVMTIRPPTPKIMTHRGLRPIDLRLICYRTEMKWVYSIIIRPHCTHSVMRPVATDGVACSVCLLITFVSPAKNWTNRDVDWRVDPGGPKEPCGPDSTPEGAI